MNPELPTFDDPLGGPPMRPTAPALRAALFDGACGVCSRSARFIGQRDPDHRVERLDLRDPASAQRFPSFSTEDVRAQMHVVTGDAVPRVVVGLDAVCAVFEVLPRWSLVARVLQLPGVHFVADKGYRWFARNRLWFNRWFPLPAGAAPCTDACAVDWSAIERKEAESTPGG